MLSRDADDSHDTKGDDGDEDHDTGNGDKGLYKVSDADGSIGMEKVKDDGISMDDFSSDDVFVLDAGESCFVWVGSGASPTEKQNAMGYAHNHLMKTAHALVPITVIAEGQKSDDFEAALAA